MSKAIRLFVASLLFGTALFASAQSTVRVQVPFDFHVHGKTLPAGEYTIAPVSNSIPGVLVARGIGTEPVAFAVGGASPTKRGASLSFLRTGETYYLSGVTNSWGRFDLLPTREERLIASQQSATTVMVGGR